MDKKSHDKYVQILKDELLPALGCTEPIAVAFAAAKAREVLGALPDKVLLEASGNIIKNVKSVTVPNTGGMKGLEAAVAAGIIAGDANKKLEVIQNISEAQIQQIVEYLKDPGVSVIPAESSLPIDIILHMSVGDENVKLRLADEHTKIVYIEKNGNVLVDEAVVSKNGESQLNGMTVNDIYEFANECILDDVRETISRQIEYNTTISEEGLRNPWGANIGKAIMKYEDSSRVEVRAKAKAAAGSDARMSGCGMPVVINSGSGNQGLTVSLPIIEYANEFKVSEEKLYRALVFGNLVGIHLKADMGRLGAYCGAISAGCAAGAGIAYLNDCSIKQISHLIVNCLAITSGIVCDGAKPSCAAKIAMGVDAAILAYNMTLEEQQFRCGEGLVKKGVENTIKVIAELGREGMKDTDRKILSIMTRTGC